MRGQLTRLDKLAAAINQTRAATDRGHLIVVYPDAWPADVQSAYNHARNRGDDYAQDNIIERMTGDRPVRIPGTVTMIVCHKPDGT